MATVSTRAHGNEVTAGKPKAKADRDLYCVEIKPAEAGGFVAEHRYRLKPSKGKGESGMFYGGDNSETFALGDKAALSAHIAKYL